MRALLLLVGLLLTFSVAAGQDHGQDHRQWQQVRSDADGFSIEMPEAPKITSRDLAENQTQKFFTLEVGSETYLASVIQLNPGRVPANPDQAYFDTLVKAYTDGSKTTLRSSRLFTWLGRPAAEGIAEGDGVTHLIDVTTAGDRIYLVVYAGPKAQETTTKATHLRDSFKLLDK